MSLDISNDTQVLVPVCEPVLTSGITVIKLKLQQPQVAQVGVSRVFSLSPANPTRISLEALLNYFTSFYGL